jgi:tetratricopeptide (TPR) repeat protein
LLAEIAFEAEKYLEAGKAFEKLIALRPRSDMISLGLFHSLWEQERFREALEEIKRFVKIVDKTRHKEQINEYMEILKEIEEKNRKHITS